MNIVLSKTILNKTYNISMEEYIQILGVGEIISVHLDLELLKTLEEKGYIKTSEENKIHLREKGIQIIEDFKIDNFDLTTKKVTKSVKKSNRAISEDVKTHIQEYRNVFKGFKAGAMGDPKATAEKLTRWLDENPNYSMNEVIKAAKLYVGGIENIKYLRRADYFIYKKEDGKEETSTLSAIIEEISDVNISDDWITTFK